MCDWIVDCRRWVRAQFILCGSCTHHNVFPGESTRIRNATLYVGSSRNLITEPNGNMAQKRGVEEAVIPVL